MTGIHINSRTNLFEIQRHLAGIYPNLDISLEFQVHKVVANCGLAASNYENNAADSAPYIEAFAWIMSIFNTSSKVYWEEYYLSLPKCCPYCMKSTCVCSITKKMPAPDTGYRVRDRDIENQDRARTYINDGNLNGNIPTIDGMVDDIFSVYPNNFTAWDMNKSFVFAKLLKHVGRLSKACTKSIHDRNRELILRESMRLSLWLFASWRLSVAGSDDFSAGSHFADRYNRGCPICGETPCDCGDARYRRLNTFDLHKPNTTTNDPTKVLNEQIYELNQLVARSLGNRAVIQSEGRAPSDLISDLNDLSDVLTKVDKKSTELEAVAKRIGSLISWIGENFGA